MRKYTLVILLISIASLLVSACGQAKNPAVKAVEDYLDALVTKDASKITALSCADWESNALLELNSLQTVTTRLEDLACTSISTNGTTTQVNCKGNILATYNGEDQQLDLSVRNYQVVQQGSDFLVCGYQ